MKKLERNELHLVAEKFRPMVEAAWANGEDVPHGVIYLSDAPITETELKWARTIIDEIKEMKLED